MIKSYFIIAIRNLANNPLHSVIKLSGLAVGVAGCLVILLISQYELSFDRFQPDKDRIYRIYSQFSGIWEGHNRGIPMALPGKVVSDFTGLESSAFFQTYSTKVVITDSTGAKRRLDNQRSLVLAGPEYFDVFNFYQWIAGSPSELKKPFCVVLTESKALNYFGTALPQKIIGKQIVYSDSLEVTLVGLVKDVDERTDFEFTDFISFSTIESSWLKNNYNKADDWGSTNSSSQYFIKLAKGTELQKIEGQLPILVEAKEAVERNADTKTEFLLQPLSNLHFNTKLGTFDQGRSSANFNTLSTLSLVALLLLLIAAINFINLETAQAVRRAKEVGLRKVMGGTRSSLIRHFLGESVLITTSAVLLSLPLCYLSFLIFEEFLPKGLTFRLGDPFLWAMISTIVLVVAALAGVYPALVLSSYQPAAALKNMVVSGRLSRSAGLRKILTVFQFSFSQVLIISTLIVSVQIRFMLETDLGFSKDAILSISTPWWDKPAKVEGVYNELASIPEVVAISRNSRLPASSGYSTTTVKFNNGKEELGYSSHIKSGDTSYLRVFKIRLLAGRNVQPRDNVFEMLINETFCNKMGFEPRDAVGQMVKTNSKDYTIVGVINDFHFQSLHHVIEPMHFTYQAEGRTIAVQLSTLSGELNAISATLAKINEIVKKHYPDETIEAQFFDKTIEQFYQTEKRIAKLANTATGLAIFISCLGLFGLASYTAVQRTKEIGIRKALGATVNSIVTLLSREFLVLVSLAFFAAVPIAWYTAERWLSDFAFRIDMNPWIFVASGVLSVVVAFLTVGFQALKAAMADPVESLRYE